MGLHIVLKRGTTCLNLSRCLRPDTQILISARMAVVNQSNNDTCEGLSHFEGRCIVIVRRCVLMGDAKNQQGCFLLSARPHPVFLVKSRDVVMFSKMWGFFKKDVKKYVCVLIIDVCINCSESHIAGFIGRLLCTSTYGCIFTCLVLRYCRQNRVTWGRIFWCNFSIMVMRRWFTIIRLFMSVQIKGINTKIRGWSVIIWMFMSVQIKYTKNAQSF